MSLLPANVRRELVIAGATGALGLISPAVLPTPALLAYRVACAGLSGVYTYDTLRKEDTFGDQPAARFALAVGMTGAMFGTMGLWERCDSAAHRWLVARGVKHPRLVIAAGTAVTSLVSGLVGSAMEDEEENEEGHRDTAPELVDLDPRLRALVAAILAATDDFSAPVLREQLTLTQAEVWDPEEGPDDELPGFVGLAVAGAHDVARAVPHSFAFPVRAEFQHAGATFEVELDIQEGRLSSVSLTPAADLAPEDAAEPAWPTTWPTVDDISLRHESATD